MLYNELTGLSLIDCIIDNEFSMFTLLLFLSVCYSFLARKSNALKAFSIELHFVGLLPSVVAALEYFYAHRWTTRRRRTATAIATTTRTAATATTQQQNATSIACTTNAIGSRGAHASDVVQGGEWQRTWGGWGEERRSRAKSARCRRRANSLGVVAASSMAHIIAHIFIVYPAKAEHA